MLSGQSRSVPHGCPCSGLTCRRSGTGIAALQILPARVGPTGRKWRRRGGTLDAPSTAKSGGEMKVLRLMLIALTAAVATFCAAAAESHSTNTNRPDCTVVSEVAIEHAPTRQPVQSRINSAKPITMQCVQHGAMSSWRSIAASHPSDYVEHGGGLNACGCHFNRKTGACHCHQDRGCGCECQPARCP